jgi:hypothetical protein
MRQARPCYIVYLVVNSVMFCICRTLACRVRRPSNRWRSSLLRSNKRPTMRIRRS